MIETALRPACSVTLEHLDILPQQLMKFPVRGLDLYEFTVVGFILPAVALILVLAGAAALGGGIALTAWGFSERQSMEEILAGGGGDAPVEHCRAMECRE